MTRPWITWGVFGVFILALLAPMAWLSITAISLDEAQEESRRHNRIEESVGLALWRLDSALGDLIAEEARRPYQFYTAFFKAEEAFQPRTHVMIPGGVLLPSPLLGFLPEHVLLHFQFGAQGAVSSPQVPTGGLENLAYERYTSRSAVAKAKQRLEALASRVRLDELVKLLPEGSSPEPQQNGKATQQPSGFAQDKTLGGQFELNRREWAARNDSSQLRQNFSAQNRYLNTSNDDVKVKVVTEGASRALWVNDCLLLARRVTVDGRPLVQGAWVDWKSLEPWLLTKVADVLAEARLEPVNDIEISDPERTLTSLPVRLVPGQVPALTSSSPSPIRYSLSIAWGCVLLAAVAVGVLLVGTLALSERRRDFVSAVTHELRTPLTTFRMYTEMLAEGMVPEGERQQEYLQKLRLESDRLAHLVENVLSYARLEARGRQGRLEPVKISDLFERLLPRLRERAAQGLLELVTVQDASVADAVVSVDVSAVDQILFNLVDNAAKYAAIAEDRRLHVEARASRDGVALVVRDHGPGIPESEERRLFRPFTKARGKNTVGAPGVGLGLSLSRRLARSLGGDLTIDRNVTDGAGFILQLPSA